VAGIIGAGKRASNEAFCDLHVAALPLRIMLRESHCQFIDQEHARCRVLKHANRPVFRVREAAWWAASGRSMSGELVAGMAFKRQIGIIKTASDYWQG
jgi:hypothetical protein